VPDFRLTVPTGRALHARPAAALVRAAARFRSTITVENLSSDFGPADVRSILSLLSLGATAGAELRITAVGDDAAEALAALELALRTLFEAETPV
jgi:phosphocarrier protein HPr